MAPKCRFPQVKLIVEWATEELLAGRSGARTKTAVVVVFALVLSLSWEIYTFKSSAVLSLSWQMMRGFHIRAQTLTHPWHGLLLCVCSVLPHAAEQLAAELKEGQPLLESIDWAAALDALQQIRPESIMTFFEAQLAESGGKKPTPALVGVGCVMLYLILSCGLQVRASYSVWMRNIHRLPRQARDEHPRKPPAHKAAAAAFLSRTCLQMSMGSRRATEGKLKEKKRQEREAFEAKEKEKMAAQRSVSSAQITRSGSFRSRVLHMVHQMLLCVSTAGGFAKTGSGHT